MSTQAQPSVSHPKRHTLKIGLASWSGTTIEWYDFYIYATAAALVFPDLFFPQQTAVLGTISALATYGVGFASRPIGAILFGHLGDRAGRKRALVITLVGMGICTTAIGLLPTYSSWGPTAALLLVFFRFAQGIAVGGEWGGAILLGLEHARRGRQTFYASFAQVGSPTGLLLATGMFYLVGTMPDDAFMNYGWRIPFLASAILVIIGLAIRLKIEETPEFIEAKTRANEQSTRERAPLFTALREDWRRILLGMALNLSPFAAFYLVNTFLLFYLTSEVGVPRTEALIGQTVVAVVQTGTLLPFAWLSDRIGVKRVATAGGVVLMVIGFPLFAVAATGNIPFLVALIVVATIGMTGVFAPCASIIQMQFGTRTRYTSSSLAYHLNSVIAGALVPIIATALVGWTGGSFYGASTLLVLFAVLGIASIAVMPNNVNEAIGEQKEEFDGV